MFMVLLTFSDNKSLASEHMEAHKTWAQQGFNDGVFCLVGSVKPNIGGALIANNVSLEELQQRVGDDPFVQNNIVQAKIIEIDVARTSEALASLAG